MGAQYCVGCAYTTGEGEVVAADPEAAAVCFEKAAEGGHVEAQAYSTGSGVAANPAAATGVVREGG